MKTRLLKKLRKEAKRYIRLEPCGFEESYDQCFSHYSTPVKICVSCLAFCMEEAMKKYMTYKDMAEVDGVDFTYGILSGVVLSWGWFGVCRLDKAKTILKKLRREYILQKVECLKGERRFKNNEKEYEKFKKYIYSL